MGRGNGLVARDISHFDLKSPSDTVLLKDHLRPQRPTKKSGSMQMQLVPIEPLLSSNLADLDPNAAARIE